MGMCRLSTETEHGVSISSSLYIHTDTVLAYVLIVAYSTRFAAHFGSSVSKKKMQWIVFTMN